MINPTPSDLGKFPVPPSGQPIPRGWFGRLVRFINSLILHGDGQYLTVKHTLDGQTITPTPALLQALGNGGAPPAAGGGSGFPNYTAGTAVSTGTTYNVLSNSWLIGSVGAQLYETSFADWTLELYKDGHSIFSNILADFYSNSSVNANNLGQTVQVCIPIPAGLSLSISLNTNLASGLISTRLYLYPIT